MVLIAKAHNIEGFLIDSPLISLFRLWSQAKRHLRKALFTLNSQHGYVQDMEIYSTGKSLIHNSIKGVLVE